MRYPLLVLHLPILAGATAFATPNLVQAKADSARLQEVNLKSSERVIGTAKMEARSGSTVTGEVRFVRSGRDVIVQVSLEGLTPGKHGFHLHEKADCSAADAASAGSHLNPSGKKHGKPGASHLGDLGNLEANASGKVDTKVRMKNLSPADEKWIAGASVVVHATADDLTSQPAGNSGARVACGVIR